MCFKWKFSQRVLYFNTFQLIKKIFNWDGSLNIFRSEVHYHHADYSDMQVDMALAAS